MNEATEARLFLPTITLETGETVYAGRDRKSDPYRPMKYGNEKQASTKLESIKEDLRREGKSGAVVRQEGRFLIFVYESEPVVIGREPRELIWDDKTSGQRREEESDAEEARDAAEMSAIERSLFDIHAETASRGDRPSLKPVAMKFLGPVPSRRPQGPGKIFATVNGPRTNPRNRHNQGSGAKHVIVSNAPNRLAPMQSSGISADPLKSEILRRARLKYKLTGGV